MYLREVTQQPVIQERVTRPRVWTAFFALVIGLVAALAAGIIVSTLLSIFVLVREGAQTVTANQAVATKVDALLKTPKVVALMTGLSSAGLASVALVAASLSKTKLVPRLSLTPSRIDAFTTAIAIVMVLALSFTTGALADLLGWSSRGFLAELERILATASPLERAALVVSIGCGAGIGEELLFRGYVQTRFVKRWGAAAGIVVTTILFAAYHLDPIHCLMVLPIGAALGALAHAAQSVRPTILAHTVNNAVAVLMPGLVPKSWTPPVWTIAAGLVVAAVAAAAFARRARSHAPASTPAPI